MRHVLLETKFSISAYVVVNILLKRSIQTNAVVHLQTQDQLLRPGWHYPGFALVYPKTLF